MRAVQSAEVVTARFCANMEASVTGPVCPCSHQSGLEPTLRTSHTPTSLSRAATSTRGDEPSQRMADTGRAPAPILSSGGPGFRTSHRHTCPSLPPLIRTGDADVMMRAACKHVQPASLCAAHCAVLQALWMSQSATRPLLRPVASISGAETSWRHVMCGCCAAGSLGTVPTMDAPVRTQATMKRLHAAAPATTPPCACNAVTGLLSLGMTSLDTCR
mmetsp:Transcript_25055/g.64579  ORF Transcript_25055/g.64579 Transcript_25055/m.64579 type:complete len:217 (+) Transcript_25055:3137-3787(+)